MVGNRIKKARKFRGLTQKQLAEKIGVTLTTIQRYEGGQRKPNNAVLIAIANVLNVNPKWLMTGEGDMVGKEEDKSLQFALAQIPLDQIDEYLLAVKFIKEIEKSKGISLPPEKRFKAAKLLLEIIEEDANLKNFVKEKASKIIELLK